MAWDLTGNSKTSPENHFVGTTDKQPLVIKTDSQERLRISSDGRIGIGKTPGTAKLDVAGAGEFSDGSQILRLGTRHDSVLDVEFTADKRGLSLHANNPGKSPWLIQAWSHDGKNWQHRFGLDYNGVAYFSDKVGIGTGHPNKKLTIDYTGSTADHANMEIRGPGNHSWGIGLVVRTMSAGHDGAAILFRNRDVKNWQIRGETNGTGFQITEGGGDAEYGGGYGTPRLHIREGGNIGIGKIPGTAKLDVAGTGEFSDGSQIFRLGTRHDSVLDVDFTADKRGLSLHANNPGKSPWLIQAWSCDDKKNWHHRFGVDYKGNIIVAGDVELSGADCAEDFDVKEDQELDPGTVMVICDQDRLQQCTKAYDKKVAGVLSGAGDYRPGIILGKKQSLNTRLPLALTGKVFCKVDAQYSSIELGDLLTTSPTPGHAMKADDHLKAFGAVIGKALRPLAVGRGLIPILITTH